MPGKSLHTHCLMRKRKYAQSLDQPVTSDHIVEIIESYPRTTCSKTSAVPAQETAPAHEFIDLDGIMEDYNVYCTYLKHMFPGLI